MCMIDDADPPTLYRSHDVQHSRKARKCEECNRPISVGEPYRSASMLYDGAWSTFDTCLHCMASQNWLIAQCGGFLHGGVDLDLVGHLDELDFAPGERTALMRLIVGMRRQWRSFRDPTILMAPRLAVA
jgi:hypothetical protein